MKKILVFLTALMFGCTLNINSPSAKTGTSIGDDPSVLYRSVVGFRTMDVDGNYVGGATGFAISKSRILTAGHFCRNVVLGRVLGNLQDKIEMVYVNGNKELATTTITKIVDLELDEEEDICLMEKPKHGIKPLKLIKRHQDVNPGDRIYTIGSPLGHFPTLTEGRVVVRHGGKHYPKILANKMIMSLPITFGNSGGPVVNEAGELIGIAVMKSPFYDHISYAVKSVHIKSFLKRNGK
jgi:S1-C subfamily serine protease